MKSLPHIGAIEQILLLCSRENLNSDQGDAIKALCEQVHDWDGFMWQVKFRMIIPLVYRHLSSLSPAAVPRVVVEQLKESTRVVALDNLAMIVIQRRLVETVLEPLGLKYLFFKGPSLAQRYYQEPMLRMCRDIDLLIPRRSMVVLGRRLRELGFTSYPDPAWGSDEGLKFGQRFLRRMDWLSQEGVLIEMPSSLDLDWGRLPTDELIANSEFIEVGGVTLPVIRSEDFFTYMCRHHTRHHWARLHWIADLNAIVHSSEFDADKARMAAERRRFSRTVAAAIEIDHAAAQPEPWNATFKDDFAHEVFRHCLTNLTGDRATEVRLRKSFDTTDKDIPQPERWIRREMRRLAGRFRPSEEDFLHYPLPTRWHSAYYLLRPFLWLSRNRGAAQ